MMLPASGHVNTGPMMLDYAKDTHITWPLLKTETQLMVELTEKENCIWDMAELSCKVVGLCMRAVLESKPISRDHLRQLELEFLQQRALMKLLKPRAKKSSASERNTKRQRRKKCPDPRETASHITWKCPSATSSSGPLAMSSSKPSAMSASCSALPNTAKTPLRRPHALRNQRRQTTSCSLSWCQLRQVSNPANIKCKRMNNSNESTL